MHSVYDDAFTEETSLVLNRLTYLSIRDCFKLVLGSVDVPHLQFLKLLYCVWLATHMHLLVIVEWKDSYSTRIRLCSC